MALPLPLHRARGNVSLAAVAILVAAAVGALSVLVSTMALALVVGAVVALVVARDVTALPLFLVFTMFVESLSLGPALRVGRIAGALALLVVAYYLLDRGRRGLRSNMLLGVVAAWGLWALASVYWADFSGPVFSTLASYVLGVAYTLAFALLVRRPQQLRWLFLVLAVGSLVFGLVAFVQYAGSSATTSDGARAAGLQGDPNYFAVYQVIALAPTLVLAAFERRAQRRLLLYAVVGVIVVSVVSSLSRTGVIALLVVVLATMFLPSRLFFARAGRKATYFLSLVGATIVAVGVGSTAFVSRVQSIFNATSSSGDRGAGRTDLWAAAWHGYSQHPWFGLGAGNFTPHALDLLQTTPGVDTTRNYITTANVVHNGYLEQLTELGPVGLALWFLILVLSARYLIRAAKRARLAGNLEVERYAAAAAVSLGGYAISVFFLSNELGKPIWIFAGLALALDVMTRQWEPLRGAPSYHRDVASEEQDRLSRELHQLVLDQERMDRRRAALDERERELAGRERSLGAAPAATAPAPVVDDGAVRRLEAQVSALEKVLASREAAIERLQAERAEQPEPQPLPVPVLPDPGRLVPAPEPEPKPEPEPVAAPEPEPALDFEPVTASALQPIPGRWDLFELERAIAQYPGDPQADEWSAYALFLRDHADLSGLLPISFDALVDEVYGALIARVGGA